MGSIRREIKEVERQFEEADAQYADVSERLRLVTQGRLNTEEELLAANVRLKGLLGELQLQRQLTAQQQAVVVEDTKMTMGELSRKVETALMSVLDERFRDEAFISAVSEQSLLTAADKVRVEFENDEVFWALQDNYTFEMLLSDAARYWDIAAQDVMLVDERGAIWPNDAYVQLEIQRNATAKIALKMKPVAVTVEEDIEMYGKEGDEESDEEEEFEQSMLAIAAAAEDELLLAQARGKNANLTNKQKLALRRKLKFDLYYFLSFVTVFIWSTYSRRTVKDAFQLQNALVTAFVEENFGDYNEKTYLDIATTEELFDWMDGPLKEGLFPDELYNGQPLPPSRMGYVMTYNRVVGKIRLRQLRVEKDESCKLSPTIHQYDTTSDGTERHRQFVAHCYGPYSESAKSTESFGPPALQVPFMGGFAWSSKEDNKLSGSITGVTQVTYDGSGFVRDLDAGNRTAYIEALDQLRSNLWIDERTRALVISLNVYNGNYNYYCISQFMLEFTPGGTIVPTATNKILRMDLYEPSTFNNVLLVLTLYVPEAFTILGMLGMLGYFLYRLYRVKKVTKSFRNLFRDTWVIIDVLLIATLMFAWTLRVTFYLSAERTSFTPFNQVEGGVYREMSGLAGSYSFAFLVDALTVLILVIKSLKYFSLQKEMMLLQRTLGQAINDLAIFLAMLTSLFYGFVIMGTNIFGTQARGFKSTTDTIGTLFLILLGEFDFDEMAEVSLVWALIFFVFFVVFMFFIVLNIFLAILNDAYTSVQSFVKWDQLERRKPLSLREKFEVKKAQWRERKNIKRMKKRKKEKMKAARKKKKEHEKKVKEHSLLDRISKKKRKEAQEAARAAAEAAASDPSAASAATSSTRGGAAAATAAAGAQRDRKAHLKDKPFG